MHRYLEETERQLNKLKRNNKIDNNGYDDGFGTRRECLERMRDALMNIETKEPETFYEALQLLTLANGDDVLREYSIGHFSWQVDYYLYPFYQKGVDAWKT